MTMQVRAADGEVAAVEESKSLVEVVQGALRGIGLAPMFLAVGTAASFWLATGRMGFGGAGAIMLAMAGAAVVSSVAGFAYSAVAGAVMYHLVDSPVQAVTFMLWGSIAIQVYAVARLWRDIRWREVMPFLAGGFVMVVPSAWMLLHLASKTYLVVLGGLLVAYGLYMMLPLPKKITVSQRYRTATDVVAGALGGVTGAMAAFPGGPVTIWCNLRGLDKVRQRAVFGPFILVMQVVTLVVLTIMRGQRWPDPSGALFAVPALFGAHIGLVLFNRLSTKAFNNYLYAMLILSGASLVMR